MEGNGGAVQTLEEEVRRGDTRAMLLLGEELMSDTPARARDLFRRAGKKGCAAGCFLAGLCYLHGLGAEKSLAKASEWFGTGCSLKEVAEPPSADRFPLIPRYCEISRLLFLSL